MFSIKPHQNVFKNVLFLSLKIIILTFIFKIDLASSTLSDFDQEEIISSFQTSFVRKTKVLLTTVVRTSFDRGLSRATNPEQR